MMIPCHYVLLEQCLSVGYCTAPLKQFRVLCFQGSTIVLMSSCGGSIQMLYINKSSNMQYKNTTLQVKIPHRTFP